MAKATALTEDIVDRTLVEVCARVGLDSSGADLIRIGSNAVYRLVKPVIVRISPDKHAAHEARKQVEVARWLESVGFHATVTRTS